MSDNYSFKERIKGIINGTTDYDRERKASMQSPSSRS